MRVVPKDNYIAVEMNESLPQDVHEMAALRNEVIAWTSFDPAFARDVGAYACCRAFCPLPISFAPCFLPLMLIFWPCFCCAKSHFEIKIQNQYWILTETELKVVTKDHDGCCLPGCIKAGDSVQTIPLESITDIGSNNARNGCGNSCCKPLPMMYVDTASFVKNERSPEHEAMGYGLARQDWFIRKVLTCRNAVKGNHSLNASEGAVVTTPVMERGGLSTSAADRLKQTTELHNSGILTREEYLMKRKDMIDSI